MTPNSHNNMIPDGHYSTLPNSSIMKDLDDLFNYIEDQAKSPLLNDCIKSFNSHAIDEEFGPLHLNQEGKRNVKRFLLPEFECEHLKYTLSCISPSPLENDTEELLHMSDFVDEEDFISVESIQSVLPTRRCLLQDFDATNDNEFISMANDEEDDYGSEHSTSFCSEYADKEFIQNYQLDNEGIYKDCMPWYLDDSPLDMSNILYDLKL